MKINSVGVNKVVNLYNSNKKIEEKSSVKNNKDSIQISTVGKSLSSYSIEENFQSSPEKIEALRKEVSQRTYKADANSTARKMMDIIKKRGV